MLSARAPPSTAPVIVLESNPATTERASTSAESSVTSTSSTAANPSAAVTSASAVTRPLISAADLPLELVLRDAVHHKMFRLFCEAHHCAEALIFWDRISEFQACLKVGLSLHSLVQWQLFLSNRLTLLFQRDGPLAAAALACNIWKNFLDTSTARTRPYVAALITSDDVQHQVKVPIVFNDEIVPRTSCQPSFVSAITSFCGREQDDGNVTAHLFDASLREAQRVVSLSLYPQFLDYVNKVQVPFPFAQHEFIRFDLNSFQLQTENPRSARRTPELLIELRRALSSGRVGSPPSPPR
jgi:hypothetical protein